MGIMRPLLTALLLGALLTGCSEYHGAADELGEPASTPASEEPVPAIDSSMNDPDATPADELSQADIVTGSFEPLVGAPPGYEDVGGQAYLGQEAEGTTVTVRLTGLRADTDYVSHLHVQPCDEDAGGDHFAFDPAGEAAPPNEIHLAFTTDADGAGEATVTNDQRVEGAAPSVVVHEAGGSGERIACADFDVSR